MRGEAAKKQKGCKSKSNDAEEAELLSLVISVKTDAKLTTQGDTVNPVNRKHPRLTKHSDEFPDFQERVWDAFHEESTFTSQRMFASCIS
ncbi:hypothetical protein KXW70_009575 [Aspergillus fumigatus]|nr:hypothetical protein KXW70_009575 [Aspergillus fumigatus]